MMNNRRKEICFTILLVVFLTSCGYFKDAIVLYLKRPAGLKEFSPYTQGQELPENCIFEDDFSKNLKKIDSLCFKRSDEWYSKLGFTAESPAVKNGSLPVIVTGANSYYYEKSQAFVISFNEVLLPKYPTLKLIYYDLGLSSYQHKMVTKYCKCEVRKVQFSSLPKHVNNLNTYAFKPLIVKWLYQEYGYVWWFDSAMIFTSPDLGPDLQYQQKNNIWFYGYEAAKGSKDYVILSHTRIETFKNFQEEPCYYIPFGEIQGSIVAFKSSPVANVVLRQWVSCALDKDCIAPPGAELYCKPIPAKFTEADIGKCHRYDQSILNIIFRRLYNYNVPSKGLPSWVIHMRGAYKRQKFPVTWREWLFFGYF